MRLTFVEIVAMMFTAVAALASAVQAFISFETRGEVARAIVFAERIDACAAVLSTIQPLTAKAGPDSRAKVAGGAADGRYSLPGFYYRQSAGNPAFEARHGPLVESWRTAAAAFSIVMPPETAARLALFDQAITVDLPAGAFMSREEMIAWLEAVDDGAAALAEDCRALLYGSEEDEGVFGASGLSQILN